jgi:PAS domain S-box-containing protein
MSAESLDTAELLAKLREAEQTLDAVREGAVDAVVVNGKAGQQVYTREGADRPYRALIEQMQEGAVTLTREGTILYCNQYFASMVRLPLTHIVGSRMHDFFADGTAESFSRLLSDLLSGYAAGEFTLCAANGTEIPVSMSLSELRGDSGWSAVICAVITDLTHANRRNEELRSTNARLADEIAERTRAEGGLQVALDAAGMGSWELHLPSEVIHRSSRYDQIFGYTEMQPFWNLKSFLEHFVEEDRASVRQAFAQAEITGAIDLPARIHRDASRDIRWVHLSGRTFYNDGGAPARIVGVIADVTDRRAFDDRLRQAQKIEALGQLTGGVAHDFNNLLQVISGGLQIVGRQGDPARREQIVRTMKQAIERGAGLCRQLLAFSRRQTLKAEPVDLRQLIAGMQELLQGSLRADVHVHCDFSEQLWPVEVDCGEFELVILNLALNARDAMPKGGNIEIKASNAPALADHDLDGDYVRLDIVDTGAGMSPDTLAHAFEPFFTTKEVGRGSGLGLAQAHGFVRSSGGVVRIESMLGHGTTVSLFLPRTLKTPASPPDLQSEPAGYHANGAEQVLVVEDDDEVAALTVEMINQLGYDTTRVASADAALGALAGRPVDIVFSDIMMPGRMNGMELAQEIRRRRPDMPVLLTSGYAEAARGTAATSQIRIIPKPYRIDELRDALAAVRQDARKSVQEH